MTGGRGKAEIMSKAVNQAEEKSESLTAANVLGFRITDCPVEGIIVSGEERLTKWMMPILEKEGLRRKVAELQMSRTKHMNHFSTRTEKIELLKVLHQTSLPPLSAKFIDLNNFEHLRIQFAKMIKVEVQGIPNFKYGSEIPDSVLEWLDETWQEAFLLTRGQNYEKALKQVSESIGFNTIALFYKALIKSCYAYRLGGEQKLDTFHVHLPIEVVRELLDDKEAMEAVPAPYEDQSPAEDEMRKELEREQRQAEEEQRRKQLQQIQKQKDQRKVEAEQRREQELAHEEEQRRAETRCERRSNDTSTRSLNRSRSRSRSRGRGRSRSRDQMANFQEWQELLTPGILKEMHEHGVAPSGQVKILQLLGKEVRDGLVVSTTMGDGQFVSDKILPADKRVAKDMLIWPQYSMVKLEDVSIHRDKIILNQASMTTDKVSEQPLLAEGVKEFEFLHAQTLCLWGLKFPKEVQVDMNHQPVTADLNSTLLSLDNGLKEVSTKQPRSVTSQLRRQSITKRPRPSPPGSPAGSWGGASPVAHRGQSGSSTESHRSVLSPASQRSVLSPASQRSGLSPASQRSGLPPASQRSGPSPSSHRGDLSAASVRQEGNNLPSTQGRVSLDTRPATPGLIVRPGGKRFKCDECAGHKTFRDEILYDSHMYNHHGKYN